MQLPLQAYQYRSAELEKIILKSWNQKAALQPKQRFKQQLEQIWVSITLLTSKSSQSDSHQNSMASGGQKYETNGKRTKNPEAKYLQPNQSFYKVPKT